MVSPDKFICFKCKHFRPISGGCDAFPDGIPMSITDLGDPHDVPLAGQGNDIVFEQGEPEENKFDESEY